MVAMVGAVTDVLFVIIESVNQEVDLKCLFKSTEYTINNKVS